MLLQHDLPLDNLRSMLYAQQASVQEQIRREESRLARVEARLKQIEHEDRLLHYDIVVKDTEPQTIICTREIVPTSKEVEAYCLRLVHKIAQCQPGDISLIDWAHTNGYNTGGLYRQIMLQGPERIPVTEAQLAMSKMK